MNTGTTSLQRNFFSRRSDIFYLGEPYGDYGGIFANLRDIEDFRYDEPRFVRLCDEQIFSKVDGKKVVISDETLCDYPQLYFAPSVLPRDVIALRLFRMFYPAKIVFTIRRQEDYIASMYLNLKRNSAFFSRMPIPPLSRWYAGMLSQLRCHYLQNLDFREAINLYEKIFGRKNILVLPLERLTLDGPREYLGALCEFIGIELSQDDIDHFVPPRNIRMSELKNLTGELLQDDRFFAFYSSLEQNFGRQAIEDFLDRGERATVALGDEELVDLRQRVASGNRLLAEEYDLDLTRYGYATAAGGTSSEKLTRPGSVLPTGRASGARIEQLVAIIDTERQAKASQVADMKEAFAAERAALVARMRELEATLQAEHEAFVARITGLDASIDSTRQAQAKQIAEMQGNFAAEREAFVARIRELEVTLQAEHEAFVARITELDATLDSTRQAQAKQMTEMQGDFAAERQTFVDRIRELEATPQAQRETLAVRTARLIARATRRF